MTPLRQERNLSSPLFLSRFPRVALFPAAIIAASICAPGRGRRKNAVPASGCHAWAEPGSTRHSHKRGPVAHCASSPLGDVGGVVVNRVRTRSTLPGSSPLGDVRGVGVNSSGSAAPCASPMASGKSRHRGSYRSSPSGSLNKEIVDMYDQRKYALTRLCGSAHHGRAGREHRPTFQHPDPAQEDV